MSDFVNTIDVYGDDETAMALVSGSLTEFADNVVTTIKSDKFRGCAALISVDLPAVTYVNTGAFRGLGKLSSVKFNAIGTIAASAFESCGKLVYVDLGSAARLDQWAFYGCGIKTLVIRDAEKCSTVVNQSLYGTPIASKTGFVYVPGALIDKYKSATNWSVYADQFRILEEWTVDGTITGELDLSSRHSVFFYADNVQVGSTTVRTGGTAVYEGVTPVKSGVTDPELYEFIGWYPEPSNITGETRVDAMFKYNGSMARGLIQRTVQGSYANDRVTIVGSYAFAGSKISHVSFPAAKTVGENAFRDSTNLVSVDISNTETVGSSAFRGCINLVSVSTDRVKTLRSWSFWNCRVLQKFDFPVLETLYDTETFTLCSKMTALILRNDKVVNYYLGGYSYPALGYNGPIYVPKALVDSYKANSAWKNAADRYGNTFLAIEDYPEICGGDV